MSAGDCLCKSDMFWCIVDAVWVRRWWWWYITPAKPGEKGHETELKASLKTSHVFRDNWLDDDGPSYDRSSIRVYRFSNVIVMYNGQMAQEFGSKLKGYRTNLGL